MGINLADVLLNGPFGGMEIQLEEFAADAFAAPEWVVFSHLLISKVKRELVRRKWTFQSPNPGGSPRVDAELEMLIIRRVRENPRIGLIKIQGELLKLGYTVDRTTIRNVMRRHDIPPAPERGRSSCQTFLNHYRTQMLACDFFTVETVILQTIYVLFFIELGSRQVPLAVQQHQIALG